MVQAGRVADIVAFAERLTLRNFGFRFTQLVNAKLFRQIVIEDARELFFQRKKVQHKTLVHGA